MTIGKEEKIILRNLELISNLLCYIGGKFMCPSIGASFALPIRKLVVDFLPSYNWRYATPATAFFEASASLSLKSILKGNAAVHPGYIRLSRYHNEFTHENHLLQSDFGRGSSQSVLLVTDIISRSKSFPSMITDCKKPTLLIADKCPR